MNVPINSYVFKPKGGADTPKLLVVFAEENKNIGSASSLAKSLGYKDARAADDALVQEVLTVKKSEGSLCCSQSFVCQRAHASASSLSYRVERQQCGQHSRSGLRFSLTVGICLVIEFYRSAI